ncbi:MAG: VOC family protein [Neomegalonema sp.]|nr:VOC family protein [Neomegalonema sp.]
MHFEHGSVHWLELNSWEPAKAREFYSKIMGWKFEAMPMATGDTYWVALIGDKAVAGIFEMHEPEFTGVPEHWLSYFAVRDIDETCQQIKASGGSIRRAPFDVPAVGRIAIVQDALGAIMGMMTPAIGECS